MADASFQQEYLEAHNAFRRKHNAPPLALSGELTAAAQKWAEHLLAAGSLAHSNTQDGENVFNMYSSAPLKLTGHFTQVVWKESTQLGVGVATNGNAVFVVGQYRPAGNMTNAGYFEKNVLPLAGREVGGAKSTSSQGGGASPKAACTVL
ncbi:Golgi-associated plant pathogenesis-related protein 1 [Liparis tanakae]|uniref:Golgi-associated plant pathogenesis-related protein 1 n=1 Tax=Liparis tanakae TaxID=230148 RepID=A0A4Z2F2Z3_9TELE|nr:Golgi-associated plant pathogenesis-related protein 1 [Liparis tanakae]